MALSVCDADKYKRLLDRSTWGQPSHRSYTLDPEIRSAIRQRQRRLTKAQVAQTAERYQTGSTITDLAAELGCSPTTLSKRLKAIGVEIRSSTATEDQIKQMVELYQSGLSLARVGTKVGVSAWTVLKYLRQQDVVTRGTDGRPRNFGGWGAGSKTPSEKEVSP